MAGSVAAVDQLADQMWRLNNLYTIIDKDGQKVPFRLNWAQEKILSELTPRHLIPKGRQFGVSTLMGIVQLDCCLFEPGFSTVTVAHDLEAAEKLFYRNIKLPYDNLPEGIKQMVSCYRDRARELRFSNESMVSVVTSARSGSYQLIHVSEFGKICAKYPDKAREIVTGTFEAAGSNSLIVVESTAEGDYGYFRDYCMDAHNAQLEGRELNPLDWRMTFLPWWKHPDYVLSPRGVRITPELKKYFKRLEVERGIKLSPARKAWYSAKSKTLGEDIRREYPAYLEEAFEQSIEGAYYANEMLKAREEGRITTVPHQRGAKVDTWWDLGVDDSTAIWFVQEIGRELHCINYYENNGEGLPFYAKLLREYEEKYGYIYGEHVAPHDIEVFEIGPATTRLETAARLGLRFTAAPRMEAADYIEAVRNEISRTWFDAEKCADGIKALDHYQKEWDDKRGTFRDRPLHNWASHGSDAYRHGVTGRRYHVRPRAQPVKRRGKWGS